jgi:hypothetical protein
VGPVRGSAAMVSQAENWKLLQTIGDKPVGTLVDGDVVSAVEFDEQVYQTLNPKPISGIIGDEPVGTLFDGDVVSAVEFDEQKYTHTIDPQLSTLNPQAG